MKTFNEVQLYQAIDKYLSERDALIAEAKSQVVQWKAADGEMFGLSPLHNDIAMRGDGLWRPAQRQWLTKMPKTNGFQHGLDANDRVLIIEGPYFIKLFVGSGDIIDEVRYMSANNRNLLMTRYMLENGRTVACYECQTSPQQYTYETFHYEQDKCVSSEARSRYVADDDWVDASWIVKCTFQFDAQGLVRAYRDAGSLSGGRQCVYVRAGAGGIAKQQRHRKPFAAFAMVISDDEEDKSHAVYSNAYGIEMSIDDEWPVDIVLLTPPELVSTMTDDTEVTSMQNVAGGGGPIQDVKELRQVQKAGGKWVHVLASHSNAQPLVDAAIGAKLQVIFEVRGERELSTLLSAVKGLNSQTLVVAINLGDTTTPESAQVLAAAVRAELNKYGGGDGRVVLAARLAGDEVAGYVAQPDIDGVLHHDDTFASYLSVLTAIVLECA